MNPTTLSKALAAGRLAYATALVIKPDMAARPWIGNDVDRPAVKIVLRAFGIRDAGIGGGILAVRDGEGLRPWLAVAAASDLVDLIATVAAPKGSIPSSGRWATAAIAGASTVAHAALHASSEG